jgi:hypothetical protein
MIGNADHQSIAQPMRLVFIFFFLYVVLSGVYLASVRKLLGPLGKVHLGLKLKPPIRVAAGCYLSHAGEFRGI